MVSSNSSLQPDRMWVRGVERAEPCSKAVLFISPVTLLCNSPARGERSVCTVDGEGGGYAFFFADSIGPSVPVC